MAENIGLDRDSINESFHHDYIDDAIESEEYKLASKKNNESFSRTRITSRSNP